jgi:hypothetical protein
MYQPTYTDSLRMEAVLLAARAILVEAEEIAQGSKVRITIHGEGRQPQSCVYPARVAEYAAQLIGPSTLFPEAPKVVFFTQGAALVTQPTSDAYYAFLRAILAHHEANLRRNKRELARLLRTIAGRAKGGYRE